MTEITFNNFETTNSSTGIVASFDIHIADTLTVQGCVLFRPRENEGVVHIMSPKDRRSHNATVRFDPVLHTEMNIRIAKLYSAATGINVEGSTWRTDPKPNDDAEPASEADDAGLCRVIGETMQKAGL